MAIIDAGFDVGNGNGKVVVNGKAFVVANHIVPALKIAYDVTAFDGKQKRARGVDASLIEYNGSQYWIGLGAHLMNPRAEPIEDYSKNRLIAGYHARLVLYAALSKTKISGDRDEIRAYVGLPFDLAASATVKEDFAAIKSWLTGVHEWKCDGVPHKANIAVAKAQSQAMGAYADFAYGDDGKPNGNAKRGALYGVLSVGFGTIETAIIRDNQVVSPLSIRLGVSEMIRQSLDTGVSIVEGDSMLRTGEFSLNGNRSSWSGQVIGKVESAWLASISRMHKIIVVGGGVRYVRDELSRAFGKDKLWIPPTEDEEICSIARGLCKMALSI